MPLVEVSGNAIYISNQLDQMNFWFRLHATADIGCRPPRGGILFITFGIKGFIICVSGRRQPSVADKRLYVGGRFPLISSPRGTGPLGFLQNNSDSNSISYAFPLGQWGLTGRGRLKES